MVIAGPVCDGISCGAGPLTRGTRRLDRCRPSGSRSVPGAPRAGRHHARHRCPRDAPAGSGPSPTSTRTACSRPATPERGLLHPAAAKVITTLTSEWDGLACHRDLPQLPLDNYGAERALRTTVIGRKNFYGSDAKWAAHLAADFCHRHRHSARHPVPRLAGQPNAGMSPRRRRSPSRSGPRPLLLWAPQGRARRRPASDLRRGSRSGPRNPSDPQPARLVQGSTLRPGLRPEGVALGAVWLTGSARAGTFGVWLTTSRRAMVT